MGSAADLMPKLNESSIAAGLAETTSSAIDLIKSKTESQAAAIKNKFHLKSNITISLDNEDGVEAPVLTD